MDSRTPWTPEAVVKALKQAGDRAAIITVTGGVPTTMSGTQLLALVNGAAAAFRDAGIAPGDTVAIWAPNSPRWVAAGLACHLTGVILAPIDAMLSVEDACQQARDSGARLTLIPADHRAAFGPEDATLPIDSIAPSGDPPEIRQTEPDEPIALFRTSGTTGRPKLFHLSLRNIGWNVRFICQSGEFTADDRVLLPLPMHHVFPWITATLSCLTLGAVLILPETPTGPHIAEAMRETRPTILIGVPRLYEALLAAIRARLRGTSPLAERAYEGMLALVKRLRALPGGAAASILLAPIRRSIGRELRLVISGGAHLDAGIEAEMEALGWDVRGGYGLAETSASITAPIGGKRLGSTGRPVDGCKIRIDAPNADGIGEILVKGPVVFSGYLGNAEANANAFTEDGFFRTGDLGRLDPDGFLFVTGRAKEVIVLSGGDNVFPEDVERHYLEDPVIAEIGILEKDGALVAVVVPDMAEVARRKLIDPREIVSVSLATIAKRLPSTWRLSGFVLVHEPLPRTRLLKLRRFLLPQIYEDALAAGGIGRRPEMTEADKAWLAEEPQARIWALIQREFPDREPTLDGLITYDLGLDSFGWMNLSLAIETETGITLTLADISRIATLRDLLTVVLERRAAKPEANHARELRIAEAVEQWLSPRRWSERQLGRLLFGIDVLLMRTVFPLSTEGAEVFAGLAGRPVLLCPNHVSELDPLALGAALPTEIRWRTHWAGSRGAAFGTFLRRAAARSIGMFPVDQEAPFIAIALAREVLRRRRVQVWFPEGMLSPDGKLLPFHDGIGRLLEDLDVAVVPVVIEGTYAAHPRESRIPRPHRLRVIFGTPIGSAALFEGAADAHDVAGRLRDRVAALGRANGLEMLPDAETA